MTWMDMSDAEIAETLRAFGAPAFRTKQVKEWLNKGTRPQDMSNLPKDLRLKMQEISFGGASIFRKYVSAKDGTIKYLFALEDDNIVEGVLMGIPTETRFACLRRSAAIWGANSAPPP